MCAAAEFLTRDDGFPGLEKTYGFDLPDQLAGRAGAVVDPAAGRVRRELQLR